MQEQSGLVRSQGGLMISSIEKSIILKEQTDKKEVLKVLVYLLTRIAKLYQIPNFDNENAVLLASWTFEAYKYDSFETIEKALTNPKPLDDNAFRLTPDTVAKWISIELENKAGKLESEHQNNKSKTIEFTAPENLSEETETMIQEYLNSLAGPKLVQAMTDEDILKFGKERIKIEAKSLGYVPPNKEYVIEKELKRRYYLEMYDKVTGKPLENWMSFEEWKLL